MPAPTPGAASAMSAPGPRPEPPLWRRLVYGRSLKRTLLRAALLMSVAFVVFRFILIPVRIEGDSMAPTYRDGGVNFIGAIKRHIAIALD